MLEPIEHLVIGEIVQFPSKSSNSGGPSAPSRMVRNAAFRTEAAQSGLGPAGRARTFRELECEAGLLPIHVAIHFRTACAVALRDLNASEHAFLALTMCADAALSKMIVAGDALRHSAARVMIRGACEATSAETN
jgi:hypothetical protein